VYHSLRGHLISTGSRSFDNDLRVAAVSGVRVLATGFSDGESKNAAGTACSSRGGLEIDGFEIVETPYSS